MTDKTRQVGWPEVDMAGSLPLEGKVAVVTGAGRGIGRAIAVRFAEAGASLAICARTVTELDETRSTIREIGRDCLADTADLAAAGAAGGRASTQTGWRPCAAGTIRSRGWSTTPSAGGAETSAPGASGAA